MTIIQVYQSINLRNDYYHVFIFLKEKSDLEKKLAETTDALNETKKYLNKLKEQINSDKKDRAKY